MIWEHYPILAYMTSAMRSLLMTDSLSASRGSWREAKPGEIGL
jgi:hypothetical protein